jgi:hypothetical protein
MDSVLKELQNVPIKVTVSYTLDKDVAEWVEKKMGEINARSKSSIANALLKFCMEHNIL